jgi:DNA-binding CsgD family transcriptional regulator
MSYGYADAGTLTPRMRALVGLLAGGATTREAAVELHISYATARAELVVARERTQSRTTVELVAVVVRRGDL